MGVTPLPTGITAPTQAQPTGAVGTQSIWVNGNNSDCHSANTTCLNSGATLAPGSYGDLRSRGGSKNNPVALKLGGGNHYFEAINFGAYLRLEFTGSATISVAEQMDTAHHRCLGPATGSAVTAHDLKFWIGGIKGKKGRIGSHPKSTEIGLDNVVFASFSAPNGTVWLRAGTELAGGVVARDAEVGIDVKVTLGSAFNRSPRQQRTGWRHS
ncbi:MAG: hypothetical protein NTZ05_07850 [Chloroflexi bacterium]|nr:hypothetical protein [Chloroflexota bacterium]